jgi:hypothetical protein
MKTKQSVGELVNQSTGESVSGFVEDLRKNLIDEPYMKLTNEQREKDCYFIGEVCMTHARMKNICDRLKEANA